MRKLCFVMTALLLTASAYAGVTISCEQVGNPADGIVEVSYEATDDANLPRAFGLDITLDSDANIVEIVSGSASDDYWVYPGTIVITSGSVTNQGTPVAPDTDPGALGGVGTGGMTIEMGSLYNDPCDPEHQDPPGLTGVLFQFKVSDNCHVTIAGNSARGNVVLESTEEATDVTYTGCDIVKGVPDCWPEGSSKAEWDSVGKPDCWCIENNPRQCHGDADGASEGKNSYWTANADLGVLLAAWNKPYSAIEGQSYNSVPLICADFDHLSEGKNSYRVANTDLGILLKNWNINNKPDPNCANVLGSQE
jgi:hypothetical protein